MATSWWDRIRQLWIPTSAEKLAESEKRVLSIVRFPFEQTHVPVGDDLTINTLYTHNPNAKNKRVKLPVVLLHGFGAGVGFWLLNFDALAEQYEHVYAIDLLGCGRSSRPKFQARSTRESEQFFVDAFERWRSQLKIDKMILLGHSFGAYVGACYSMAHSERVPHLVLASPVGVPVESDTDEPTPRRRQLPFALRVARTFIQFLWNRGYTPQSAVRLMGPIGPRPVRRYVMRRFFMGPAVEDTPENTTEAGLETSAAIADQIDQGRIKLPKEDVAEYLYHLCAQKGSGEYALPRVLKSNVMAYEPLENRLGNSKISQMTFFYGDHDWMDVKAGQRVVDIINNRPNGNASAILRIIPNAGHQMMIDNPDEFHQAIFEAIKE